MKVTLTAQWQAMLRARSWPDSAMALSTLAAVIMLALAPHITHLPWWIPLTVIAATIWRLWIEVHAAALPNRWLRMLLAILSLIAVMAGFRTLNGLEAGTALLAMMAGMKMLESRQLRDYTILIYIAFFLLFAELLFEQELYLLPYLLLVTLLTVSCWLRLHDGEAQLRYRDTLLSSGRMLLQAIPLTIMLFLFIPRLPGQFWALPSRDTATTGLSDTMSPGDVSALTQSSSIAFRVAFDGALPPSAQRYWRAIVLHDFDGRSWRRLRGEIAAPQKIMAGATTYRYRMLMEPSNQPWIPVLDVPLQINLPRSILTSDLQLLSLLPVSKLTAIDVLATTDYQLGDAIPESLRRIDTRLPGALNPRSRELASQLRAQSSNDAQYVNLLLRRFREQEFYYTLEPPKLGVNSVDDFLFTTRRGFCEHFASAFTFMMRAAGIPARIVTGYQGGEINSIDNYLVVRQSDAHAWSEVWLEHRGWVRIDPTAAVAPQRVEQGLDSAIADSEFVPGRRLNRMAWMYQLRQNWDAANTFWKARIVNFDSEQQLAVLNSLGVKNPDWRTLGWALLIAFVSFFIGMMLWLSWRYRSAPSDAAVAAYAVLKRKLAGVGIVAAAHEGPVDFLTRAAQAKPALATSLQELREVYVALRYQPAPSSPLLSRLKHLVNQLRV